MANILVTPKGKNMLLQQIADRNGGKMPTYKTQIFTGCPPDLFGPNYKSRRSRHGISWNSDKKPVHA